MARKGRIKPFYYLFNEKGIDEHQGEFYIKPDAADNILNMNVNTLGEWTTYKQGYTVLGSQFESGANFDGLHKFTDLSGNTYLLGSVNGKILEINQSTGAITNTISTGTFTADNYTDMTTFKGKVYAVDGTCVPQTWTGTGSMSAVSGVPITNGSVIYDKPKIVGTFNNCLLYANFTDGEVSGTPTAHPSTVVISNINAPDTFTFTPADDFAAAFELSPGDGQSITGYTEMYIPRSNETAGILFKDNSIFILTGTTQSTYRVDRLNNNYGAVNNRSIVNIGNDVLFLDQYNIYSLSAANNSGSIQPNAVGSRQVEETLRDLNVTYKHTSWAIHLPHRNEVWFAIPTGSSQTPDTIIQLYYEIDETGAKYAWSIRKSVKPRCGVVLDDTYYTGSNDGYLQKWHESSSYGDSFVLWKYAFPYYNFNTQAQCKRIVECFLWFLTSGSQELSIRTEWRNGGNDTSQSFTKTLTLDQDGVSTYGSSTYGSARYGDGLILKKVKIPVYGNGEQFRLQVNGNSGESGITFLGMTGLVEYMGYSRSYR